MCNLFYAALTLLLETINLFSTFSFWVGWWFWCWILFDLGTIGYSLIKKSLWKLLLIGFMDQIHVSPCLRVDFNQTNWFLQFQNHSQTYFKNICFLSFVTVYLGVELFFSLDLCYSFLNCCFFMTYKNIVGMTRICYWHLEWLNTGSCCSWIILILLKPILALESWSSTL